MNIPKEIIKKATKLKIKLPAPFGVLEGYGSNCDCLKYGADCIVLYGGKCNWRYKEKKTKKDSLLLDSKKV